MYENVKKLEQLYEGKAKKVFATSDPDLVLVSYKDDATAFNGLKKGQILGKGSVNNRASNMLFRMLEAVNNRASNMLFRMLEAKGIPTHYVKELSDTETLVKKVKIVPLEVIVRNVAAGSLSKRIGYPEGASLLCPVLEFSYKNDELGDPMINDYHALAMGIATEEDLRKIKDMALKINEILKAFFKGINIDLIDFKLEFGIFHGEIILADEISPDTCRFWDSTTHEKLDKDRFRRDMGGVEDAYQEVMKRLLGKQE